MTELSALDVDLANERPGSVLDRSLVYNAHMTNGSVSINVLSAILF